MGSRRAAAAVLLKTSRTATRTRTAEKARLAIAGASLALPIAALPRRPQTATDMARSTPQRPRSPAPRPTYRPPPSGVIDEGEMTWSGPCNATIWSLAGSRAQFHCCVQHESTTPLCPTVRYKQNQRRNHRQSAGCANHAPALSLPEGSKQNAQTKRRPNRSGSFRKGSRFLHWSQGDHGPNQSPRAIALAVSKEVVISMGTKPRQ